MKSLWNSLPRAFALALIGLAVGLSGCGGGGGSTDSGDSATPVAISETNATDVASTAMLAGNASSTTSLSDGFVTGVEGTQAMPAPTIRLIELAIAQAKRLNDLSATPGAVTGVQASETVLCDVSGTVTAFYNVQTLNSVSPGDTVGLTFTNCRMDADFLIKGGMAITINSYSGNFLPNGSMSTSLALSNFYMNFAGATFNANGTMTIDTTASSSGSHSVVRSDSYSYGVSYNGTNASIAFSDYELDMTTDTASATVTWTERTHFSADFPSFHGSGDITTLTPMVESSAGITAGKLQVAGDNSTLYMTFQPGNQVHLELDSDNDGDIDYENTKNVYELNPLSELF
ncbi:MAG: hypothetical protein KJ634_08855 [Gammaproteobacteria bacterium]|nr:hypothetical protein [Gammaproteobacteria bacterium]MBU1415715.1 hypothetical protein [Gammaproteobacteria bacterium]